MSNVLHDAIESIEARHVSCLLFEVSHIAEPSPNIERVLAALRRIEIQMEAQLVLDAALVFASADPHACSVSKTIDE